MKGEIQTLLEKKSFDALTSTEKKLVLIQMSEQEYRHAFQFLALTKTSFTASALSPDEAIRTNLSEAFHTKYHKPHFITQWLTVKIPLWSILLGILLLGGIFYFSSNKQTSVPVPTPPIIEKVYVYQTDTIYLEKEPRPVLIPKKTTTIEQEPIPIAQQATKVSEELLEPVLTYLDTNTVKEVDKQIRGQQLDEDAPVIDVRVFR